MGKSNKKVIKGGASKKKRETRAEIAAPPPVKKKATEEEVEPEVPRVPLRSLPPKTRRRRKRKAGEVVVDEPPPIPENEDDGVWETPKPGQKVVDLPHSMNYDTRKKTLEIRCQMPRVPLGKIVVNPTRTTLRVSTLGFSKKYYLVTNYKGNVWCDAAATKIDYDRHTLALSIPIIYMPKEAKEEQRRISSAVVKGKSKKFEEEISKGWQELMKSAKEDEEKVAAALEAELADPTKLSKKQKRRRAKAAKKNPPPAEEPEEKKVPTSKTKKQMKKDRRKKNWEKRLTGEEPLKAMNVTPSELNVSANGGNLSAVASVPETVVKKAAPGRKKAKIFLDDDTATKTIMEKTGQAQEAKVAGSQYTKTLMQQFREDHKMERTLRRAEKRDKKNKGGKKGQAGGEEKSAE